MERNFTEEELNKLIGYINAENNKNDERFAGHLIDFVADFHYLNLDIDDYAENIDIYHQMLIDKEDYTIQKIKDLFAEVNVIDDSYASVSKVFHEVLDGINNTFSKLKEIITVDDCASGDNYLILSTDTFTENLNDIEIINANNFKELYESMDDYKTDNISFLDRTKDFLKNVKMSYKEVSMLRSDLMNLGLGFLKELWEMYKNGDDEDIEKWFMNYVPQHVSDATVIYIMTLISRPIDEDIIRYHLFINKNSWIQCIADAGKDDEAIQNGYIEHQDKLNNFFYGYWRGEDLTADYNSCEVIAVYNALQSIGNHTFDSKHDFPVLLAQFEAKGVALGGKFGTSPKIMNEYLAEEGYSTEMIEGLFANIPEIVYSIQENYSAYIITVYNDKGDLSEQIHTMCVTNENGRYYIHNAGESSCENGYASLYEAINGYKQGNSEVISVIGVSD